MQLSSAEAGLGHWLDSMRLDFCHKNKMLLTYCHESLMINRYTRSHCWPVPILGYLLTDY